MKTKQHLFLDIYAIQTLPPSNINRDDTGSPKTAHTVVLDGLELAHNHGKKP